MVSIVAAYCVQERYNYVLGCTHFAKWGRMEASQIRSQALFLLSIHYAKLQWLTYTPA